MIDVVEQQITAEVTKTEPVARESATRGCTSASTLIPANPQILLRRGTHVTGRGACLIGRASGSWSSHLIRVPPACLSLPQHRAMQSEERPEAPEAPSAPWRAASVFTMGAVGLLCKGFLGLNKIETHGMERFLRLLDERREPKERERGLITGMRLWTGDMRVP